jgi:hypothetical protein
VSTEAEGTPPDLREPLGRIVRETWVAWAKEQDDPKPGWLTGWDELDAGQREVDMRIGHAAVNYALTENAIGWNTSCTSCARLLDSAYAETVRREAAEAKLAARRRTLRRIAAYCLERAGRPPDPEGALVDADGIVAEAVLAIISGTEEARDG